MSTNENDIRKWRVEILNTRRPTRKLCFKASIPAGSKGMTSDTFSIFYIFVFLISTQFNLFGCMVAEQEVPFF